MTPARPRDPTIDVLRGLTILAVTAYHFHADARGLDPVEAPGHALAGALAAFDARGALGLAAYTLVASPAYRLDLFLFVIGVVLARAPYRFEGLDLLRSLVVVGRFQSLRTFQVVAPSMWYVMLLLHAYLCFPALNAARRAAGDVRFLVAVLALTSVARAAAFRYDPLPSDRRAVDACAGNGARVGWAPLTLDPGHAGLAAAGDGY